MKKYISGKMLKKLFPKATFINISNTYVTKDSKIGSTIIYPNCWISNCEIDDNATILPGSYIIDTKIGQNCQIGPMAKIENCQISENCQLGRLEAKRSEFGKNCKAKHICYIGDTTLGNNVNIGTGVVIANYNTKNKRKTTTAIGDNSSIGSNVTIIAPNTIGKDVTIGAGAAVLANNSIEDGKTYINAVEPKTF